ncbi:Importin_beta-3 subunit [Hexamita inflata]|uniref:Importin beta-3 subunit n=1 Tax=Hexamita inflata TaxID=28002 RepID=A0AA86R223_9EUKA|nr:Importin beta-3 subunit [Hexamita inflata]
MQQILHNTLLVIKDTRDTQERLNAEQQYQQLRAINPSDEFVQSMIYEIINDKITSPYAAVLLRKDLEKKDEGSCIYRLSNIQMGRDQMTQLLNFIAQNPEDQLIQVVAAFVHYLLDNGIVYNEAIEFAVQAYGSDNQNIRRMSVYLVQLICDASVATIQQLNFDFFGFLQKALGDQDDNIALCAVAALTSIIQHNRNKNGEPQIPQDIISQVFLAIIQRTSQALQNPIEKYSVKMMGNIIKILESSRDDVSSTLPTVIQFLTQIMQSNLTATQKRVAVVCFISMFNAKEAKKSLRTQIQQFIVECIFPGLTPTETEIQDFMNGVSLEDVQKLSLDEACATCVESAGFVLGKQIVFPLILQLTDSALQQNDYKLHLAAISAISCTEEMKDVLKQTDTEKLSNALLKLIQIDNVMTMSYCLTTITNLSAAFSPQLQKYHKQYVPIIAHLINHENERIATDASNALINYCFGLTYDQTYKYQQQIVDSIRTCLRRSMQIQANGMTLLHSICQIMDPEDLKPIFVELMPSIFQQFQEIMDAIRQVKEFTKSQVIYIESLVQLIANASSAVPELFDQYIELIAQNIVLIIQRSYHQEEHSLFNNTLKALEMLQHQYSDNLASHIEQIYSIFVKILQTDRAEIQTDLVHEGEMKITNPHITMQQVDVLQILSVYMDKFPAGLASHFGEIYQLITCFEPMTDELNYAWLNCMCIMLKPAIAAGFDYLEVHNKIFPLIFKELYPVDNNGMKKILMTNTKQCADGADAFYFYVKDYLTQQLIQYDPNYYQSEEMIFQALEYIYEKLNLLARVYQEEHEEIKDEIGEEELQSVIEQMNTEYQECMQQLSYCYSQFLVVFKDKIPANTLQKLVKIIQDWFQGTETDLTCFCTLEATGLLADIAQNTPSNIVTDIFKPMLPLMFNTLQTKPDDYSLVQVTFYAFYEYLKCTQDSTVACDELVHLAINLLNNCEENGQYDALNAYDSICVFLVHAGKIQNQQEEFWAAVVEKCSLMDSDETSIATVLEFFISNQFNGQIQLVSKLFFGQYYSKIKNDAKNAKLVGQIQNLVKTYKNDFERHITANKNEFETKNARQFGLDV